MVEIGTFGLFYFEKVNVKYACVYGDCVADKEPNSQRYRVCTLPDHPVIAASRGTTNFVEKLKSFKGLVSTLSSSTHFLSLSAFRIDLLYTV